MHELGIWVLHHEWYVPLICIAAIVQIIIIRTMVRVKIKALPVSIQRIHCSNHQPWYNFPGSGIYTTGEYKVLVYIVQCGL